MSKIPVAVLGATGAVGQRLVALLDRHPWFELAAVAASERREGEPYGASVRWILPGQPPARAAALPLRPCDPRAVDAPIVFSALDPAAAGPVEEAFAAAGALVSTNARNHRMRPEVPLVVPEVNPGHLALAAGQPWARGRIVANPNCSTIGLVLALAPLAEAFGIEALQVATLQAASGAGYPGVPSLDLLDNAIPHIAGEEEKLETEPLKILGRLREGRVEPAAFPIAAACNRVAVTEGHLLRVSFRPGAAGGADAAGILAAWEAWRGDPRAAGLPSSPPRPLVHRAGPGRPQPRLDREEGGGMSVVVGGLRPDAVLGWSFAALSHNTLRGAAGGTLLLAELAVAEGLCGLAPPARA